MNVHPYNGKSKSKVFAFMMVMLALVCFATPRAIGQQVSPRVIGTLSELEKLPMQEAEKHLPIRVSATVSFFDPDWNVLFIDDGSAGAYVWMPAVKPLLKTGQGIRVTGVTEKSGFRPVIIEPIFAVDSNAPGLQIQKREISSLMDGSMNCRWIETEGRFVKATDLGGRVQVEVNDKGMTLQVLVLGASMRDLQGIGGSLVKIQGVAATSMSNGVIAKVSLMVPSVANMEFTSLWTDELFRLNPEEFTGSAVNTNREGLTRVRGVVSKIENPRSFRLKLNETKTLQVDSLQEGEFSEGQVLDVVGKYKQGNPGTLVDAFYLRNGFADPGTFGKNPTGEVLRSVAAIRKLDRNQAKMSHRVILAGVITYCDNQWGTIFLQGSSGGIYVDGSKGPVDVHIGDTVALNGITAEGNFAPIVRNPEFRILHHGQLPPTRLMSYGQLFSGRYDCDWVETEGVVRSTSFNDGHLVLELWTGGNSATVIVPDWDMSRNPDQFVDARILFGGVAGSSLDEKNQFRGLQFFVPGAQLLKVTEPPTPSEFLPITPIHSLFGFSPKLENGHRIKTKGTIAMQTGGGRSLFIQDGKSAMYVEGATNFVGKPGDVVEILGFPSLGPIVPVMRDPKITKVGVSSAPMPVRIFDPREILVNKLDAQWVELDARLLDIINSSGRKVIILQAGLDVFDAHLDSDESKLLSKLKPGSLVRVRGVASIQVDEWKKPRFFRLLVGHSSDIELLSTPPYWTLKRLLLLIGGILVAGGLVVIYAVLLKRRVNEQTSRIREELEKSAILQERYKDLFESANDLIFTHDLEGNYTAINTPGLNLLGYTKEEGGHLKVSDLVIPEMLPLAKEMLNKKLNEGGVTTFELAFRSKSGTPVILEISSKLIHQKGKPVGVMGIGRDIRERKKHENAILAERTLLRTLIDNIPDCIYIKNADGRFLMNNVAGQELIGDRDVAEGKSVFDYFPKAMAEGFHADDMKVIQTGCAMINREEMLCNKDGEMGWFLTTKVPLRDLHGGIYGLVGVSRNITEQKRNQEALKESQRTLATLLGNLPGMVYRCVDQGRSKMAFLSQGSLGLTGYSPEEIISGAGLFYRSLIHREDQNFVDAALVGAVKSQQGFKIVYRILAKTGDVKWVLEQGSPVYGSQGEFQSVEGFVFDLTDRKKAEEELKSSQALFSKVFHASPVAIALENRSSGIFMDANQAFLHMLSASREEVVGKSSFDLNLWPDRRDARAVFHEVTQQGFVKNRELKISGAGSQPIKVLASIETLEINNEKCLLYILTDISERIQLETQLRHAQKMEAVGQLAAGVAHDFNNIMTIIQGHTALAASEKEQASRDESLDMIMAASQRAAKLTSQLLTFSRKQNMQRTSLDLNEVVSTLCKLLSRVLGEQVAVHLDLPGAGMPIQGDRGMLEQVVMNLSVNARDAMPKGGSLYISSSRVEVGHSYAQVHPDARVGTFICLSIRDTGTGMPSETMSRIFEPFFTTKEVGKGTGLGLATAYAIVQQHQGWIEVTSAPGEGTEFRVFLPEHSLPSKADTEFFLPQAVGGGNETILVVEDELPLRSLVKTILQKNGYTILEAGSGVEALKVWALHGASIALVLTDMVMPDGLSGKDLAEKLQATHPEVKIIFSSGYSLEVADGGELYREGVNFLSKPYHPATLSRVVRNALDSKPELPTVIV